jgi:hypothetical protein
VSRKDITTWIPAFAGMTKPQQAAGNLTQEIQRSFYSVIPAEAGIQEKEAFPDPGFHRGDDFSRDRQTSHSFLFDQSGRPGGQRIGCLLDSVFCELSSPCWQLDS